MFSNCFFVVDACSLFRLIFKSIGIELNQKFVAVFNEKKQRDIGLKQEFWKAYDLVKKQTFDWKIGKKNKETLFIINCAQGKI